MLGGRSLQPPPSCKAQALFTAAPACHGFHTFTQGRKEEGRKGGRKREKEKGRKERGEKVEDMKCVRPRDALSFLCSDPTPSAQLVLSGVQHRERVYGKQDPPSIASATSANSPTFV